MELSCVIPDKSGFSLAGVVNTPDDEKPHPFVLLLHGFTGWKEEGHFVSLARELSSRGVSTLRFDALGSGESGGTFADDYRLTNYLESVSTVLDYVRTNLPVDVNRMGIWGHSMGGFTALASAVRRTGELRAVCGSQPSMGKSNVSPEEEEAWRTTGWMTFSHHRFPSIDLPYAFYLDRQQYDILKIIDKLDMPLLLISGSKDVLVPAANVRAIYEAAPEPKTYKEFPVGHDYKNKYDQLTIINDVTVEFFLKSLL